MYEPVDQGYGWYLFHHHHFHVSFNGTSPTYGSPASFTPTIFLDGNTDMVQEHYRRQRSMELLRATMR